ncbi:MAG TPA: hypothetical protein PKE45_13015 [Caldilineaceae bacterium]|nr:hypothetical protein [Caldilineaceae bacterium]
MRKILSPGVGLAILLITALLSLFVWRTGALASLAPRTDTPAPTGYDPLTTQEIDQVVSAARRAAGEQGVGAAAGAQQELLLVERHEAGKEAYASGRWPRQGDVYLYDYTTDTLVHSLVDVQSGAVVELERVQGVQLPLTAAEKARALALIRADAAVWTRLADRFAVISGESLRDLTQLQVKVSVFVADAMPNQVNSAAQQCGRRRCAQVLLFTVDKTLLELMPIVDLSQGKVVQILGEDSDG